MLHSSPLIQQQQITNLDELKQKEKLKINEKLTALVLKRKIVQGNCKKNYCSFIFIREFLGELFTS